MQDADSVYGVQDVDSLYSARRRCSLLSRKCRWKAVTQKVRTGIGEGVKGGKCNGMGGGCRVDGRGRWLWCINQEGKHPDKEEMPGSGWSIIIHAWLCLARSILKTRWKKRKTELNDQNILCIWPIEVSCLQKYSRTHCLFVVSPQRVNTICLWEESFVFVFTEYSVLSAPVSGKYKLIFS